MAFCKKNATKATKISLALLDARVCNRKAFCKDYIGQSFKWSDVSEHVAALVEDACQHVHALNSALSIPHRWSRPALAAPMVLPPLQDASVVELKRMYNLSAIAWAHHNAKKIKGACASIDAGSGERALVIELGGTSWVHCMSFRHAMHLIGCEIKDHTCADKQPLETRSSLKVMASLHEDFEAGLAHTCKVFVLNSNLSLVADAAAEVRFESVPKNIKNKITSALSAPPAAPALDDKGEEEGEPFDDVVAALATELGLFYEGAEECDVEGEADVIHDEVVSHEMHERAKVAAGLGREEFDRRIEPLLEMFFNDGSSGGDGDEDAHVAAKFERDGDEDAYVAATFEDFKLSGFLVIVLAISIQCCKTDGHSEC